MGTSPRSGTLDRGHRRASAVLAAVDELVEDLGRASGSSATAGPTEEDAELASVVLELRHQEALHRAALEVTDRLLPSSLLALIR